MSPSTPMPHVLFLRDRDDDIALSVIEGFTEAGASIEAIAREEFSARHVARDRYNIVLACGPNTGSMMPVARCLEARRRADRPYFVWWLCENAPDLNWPARASQFLGGVRFRADRALERLGRDPAVPGFWTQGHRARVMGELGYFHARGLVDLLAVNSGLRAKVLGRLGIRAVFAPLGYAPIYGRDLGLVRDIDVLFLGRPGNRRRQSIVRALDADLSRRGYRLVVHDGSQGYLGYEERTLYLNRVKILLNVLKSPRDMTGCRLVMGMANQSLVVSETLADPTPFTPERHYVEARAARLSELVVHYLEDHAERQRITREAYRFVQSELDMGTVCRGLLRECGLVPRAEASIVG